MPHSMEAAEAGLESRDSHCSTRPNGDRTIPPDAPGVGRMNRCISGTPLPAPFWLLHESGPFEGSGLLPLGVTPHPCGALQEHKHSGAPEGILQPIGVPSPRNLEGAPCPFLQRVQGGTCNCVSTQSDPDVCCSRGRREGLAIRGKARLGFVRPGRGGEKSPRWLARIPSRNGPPLRPPGPVPSDPR